MIGFLMNSVSNSPRNILAVKNINKLRNEGIETCLFCDIVDHKFSVPVETNVLQKAQAFNFDGTLITHDLSAAQDLQNMVYAKKRYIYLYDLDWTLIEAPRFAPTHSLLLNEHIELIARSNSHYKIISDLFKKPARIMKYWDVEQLKELD